jgi:hypothetical protein
MEFFGFAATYRHPDDRVNLYPKNKKSLDG